MGQKILKNNFPDLFNLSLQKSSTIIREIRDSHRWDQRFRRHLNDWEINSVAELFNILEQCKDLKCNEDRLFWFPDKKGRFTAGLPYRRLQ